MDFLCHLLLQTKPRFINGGWTSFLAWKQNLADTELASECGHISQPIRMQFADIHATECSLKSLIEHWHDGPGFHRGLTQVSTGICITIDRVLDLSSPPYSHKCMQRLQISDGWIQLPVHPLEGDTQWFWYSVVAVCFHIGDQVSSGHYRTAIHCKDDWFLYDDNALPTKVTSLSNFVLSQITVIWLARMDRIDQLNDNSRASGSRPGPYDEVGRDRDPKGRGRRRGRR